MTKKLKGVYARKSAVKALKKAKIFAKKHPNYCRLAAYSYASQGYDDPNFPLTIHDMRASSYINQRYQDLIERENRRGR